LLYEVKWQFKAVHANQLGASGAFLVRQKIKITPENAVLWPLVRASSQLLEGRKCNFTTNQRFLCIVFMCIAFSNLVLYTF